MLTTTPTSFADCLEFNLLERYGAAIGEYRESLTLVSPVRPTSVSPVILQVGHMAPERAAAWLLAMRVRIWPVSRMFLMRTFCKARGRSLPQRGPNEYVCVCVCVFVCQ